MDYKSEESTMDFNKNMVHKTANRTCCFFGHRDTSPNMREPLRQAIENLIQSGQADYFYVGNQGNFDRMAYDILKELQVKYPHIVYNVVLAYLPNPITAERLDDNTIYPARLAGIPKRFAVPYRNDWMIMNAGYVICHVLRPTGGAARFVNKAKMKGLTVIPIKK